MKRNISLLLFVFGVLFSLSAQNQFISQDRDPNKNSNLYFIPEVNYGIGFLATNYPLPPFSYNKITRSIYDNYQPMSYSLAMNVGYFFTPNYAAGIGIAYERYMEPNANSLPIYLDLRGYFKDAKNTPFVFAKLGGSFSWWRAFEPGEWATVGIGYKFFLGKTCLTSSLGYEIKHVSHWEPYSTNDQIPDPVPNRWAALDRSAVTFNIGWVIF